MNHNNYYSIVWLQKILNIVKESHTDHFLSAFWCTDHYLLGRLDIQLSISHCVPRKKQDEERTTRGSKGDDRIFIFIQTISLTLLSTWGNARWYPEEYEHKKRSWETQKARELETRRWVEQNQGKEGEEKKFNIFLISRM